MASFINNVSLASLLLVLAISNTLTSSFADLIGEVCEKTTNTSLCSSSLGSDARSSSADLFTLGQISIEMAESATKRAQTMIPLLYGKSLKKVVKSANIYASCKESYKDALSNLNECSDAFNSRDFFSANIKGSAVIDGAVSCSDSFEEANLKEPQELKQISEKLRIVTSAILAISNRLSGRA